MVVISLFTRPVPLDALGALTWPTLNHPRYRGGGATAEYVVNAESGFEMSNAHGAPGEGMTFSYRIIYLIIDFCVFELESYFEFCCEFCSLTIRLRSNYL